MIPGAPVLVGSWWPASVDWTPLWLSVRVASLATVLALALGVPVALVLARRRFPLHRFVEALFTLPLVLPPTVLGYYLLVALGRQSLLGRAYEAVTGAPVTFTVHGAVLASMVHAVPMVVRTARAAVESVDPDLEAAARALGASERYVTFTITLPQARRGLAAAAALAFARALGEFGVTLMVAGSIPGATRTASLAIYDMLQAGRDDEAQALVVVMSAVAVAALVFVARLTDPRER